MKLSKLMITIVALILVFVFFSVQTWKRQGIARSTPVESDSVLENTHGAKREAGDRVLENARSEKREASDDQPQETDGGEKKDILTAVEVQRQSRINILLPKPFFAGTPKEIKGAFNLEAPRDGKPRDPIVVPVGCDTLLSHNCEVTSSDPDPIFGELSFITDGDKKHNAATYVELGPGVQWVQIDLGRECEIYAICVWHFHGEPRVYRDVVWQISNDPDFIDDVLTVFNNDHDSSAKLGIGKDKEYIETYEGRSLAVKAVKSRYLRFYSQGNTTNEMNHYTEIEVYGNGA